MKYSFSQSMKERRSEAEDRLLVFGRWWMSADWWTWGSKAAGGLLRRRLLLACVVVFDCIGR
jgi:hypothetical protein